ncbi:MAG: glycosyltransferase family 4 protein [Nitrosomonadales bacterium]|nr:glycosyltransferase family 4 protein [Nitrosomonadales bacterium]
MSYYSPAVSTLVSVSLIAAILFSRLRTKIQDIPNERSLHVAPTSRIGGIGLMLGVLSGWVLLSGVVTWWLLLPLILLFAVSLLDDMHNLPVTQRLLAQLVAAAILVAGADLFIRYGVVTALVVLLFTVWMTNLYNFMDGSDGLAGGMALFGFTFYGIAALFVHDEAFAMLNFSVAAAALGFLFFNFPPARIFMGDAGSIPLGFLSAALGLWGWQEGCWSAWFPLLVFSPFLVDASITLLRRSLRGAKVTEAHREHYYQRLVQAGWKHRDVALAEYVLMLAVGVSALPVSHQAFPWLVFIAWAGIYAMLMLMVDAKWKKFQRKENA